MRSLVSVDIVTGMKVGVSTGAGAMLDARSPHQDPSRAALPPHSADLGSPYRVGIAMLSE